jgi:AcrR family transcriptional regulator
MKRSRTTILNAAMKHFAQKGYAACSIRVICQAAGITKPVLYYHFRSKEHLYQELMMDIFNDARKTLLQVSKFRGSLRDRLVLYLSSEFRNSQRDPDRVRLLFRMMFSPEEGYPYFNYIREFQREREVIAGFIREKIKLGEPLPDPELTATALMGMILVQILEYLFTGRRTLTRQNAAKLVDLLLGFPPPVNMAIPIGTAGRSRQ